MVEYLVDIEGVAGSVPASPTKNINFNKFMSKFSYLQKSLLYIYPICR